MRAHLVHIRAFEIRDLDAAARGANAACRQAYAYFGYDQPVAASRKGLEATCAEGQSMWVPEIDGVVVGILTLRPNFIDKLFLSPEWQGRGIGTALLDHAKSLHPDGLELHCAQENRRACRLYEYQGFIAVEHRIYKPLAIGDIVYRWTR